MIPGTKLFNYSDIRFCFNQHVFRNKRVLPQVRVYRDLLQSFREPYLLQNQLSTNVELVLQGNPNILHFEIKDKLGNPQMRKIIFLEEPDTEIKSLIRDFYNSTRAVVNFPEITDAGSTPLPTIPGAYEHLLLGLETNTDMPIILFQEMKYRVVGDGYSIFYYDVDSSTLTPASPISLMNFDYIIRELISDNYIDE